MTIEVLHIEDCPSYRRALDGVRQALALEGLEAEVRAVRIESETEAVASRMAGSPTVLVDGEDLEGPAAAERGYGFGCRIYWQPAGGLAGWPSVDAIRTAVRAKTATPSGA